MGGYEGTKFFKLYDDGNNFILLFQIKEAFCGCWNGLSRLDDKIIVGGDKTITIISIKEKKIIKSIEIPFRANAVYYIKERNVFLLGGWSTKIVIYSLDDYKIKELIENAHHEYVNGFCQLNNNLILSFSGDGSIKIWSFS